MYVCMYVCMYVYDTVPLINVGVSGDPLVCTFDVNVKVKVRSYTALYPVLRTAQSDLPFISRQTCSFQRYFDFAINH